MPRLMSWIVVTAVVIAILVTALVAPGDPGGMARIVFPLFLVVLIAAGLRAIVRRPPA